MELPCLGVRARWGQLPVGQLRVVHLAVELVKASRSSEGRRSVPQSDWSCSASVSRRNMLISLNGQTSSSLVRFDSEMLAHSAVALTGMCPCPRPRPWDTPMCTSYSVTLPDLLYLIASPTRTQGGTFLKETDPVHLPTFVSMGRQAVRLRTARRSQRRAPARGKGAELAGGCTKGNSAQKSALH